ncbi:MAG: hypothetical protein LBC98_10005, partial [Prevotellaceae bacterium]|nr:hypothetical protein [Prevotellaceae bacterium]
MKTKIAAVIALFAVSIFYSCEKNETAESVNDWIFKNMKTYYLWNEEIPANTNKTLEPSSYFKSLLHRDDRFSWIQDNYLELLNSLSGVNMEAGYDFNVIEMPDNYTIVGYITYVKPASPAETKGLRRGDYFFGVNGQRMNKSNYQAVISQMSQNHTLNLAVINNDAISDSAAIALTVMEYKENPVFLDSIYNIEGKKIGYLIYNAFYADNGDG